MDWIKPAWATQAIFWLENWQIRKYLITTVIIVISAHAREPCIYALSIFRLSHIPQVQWAVISDRCGREMKTLNTEALAGAVGPVRAALIQRHEDSCSRRLIVCSHPKTFCPRKLGAVKTSYDNQRSRPVISLSLPTPPSHHKPTHTKHTHIYAHADRVHSVWPPAVWPQMGGFLSESFPDVMGFPPFFHCLSSLFPSP